MSGSSLVFRNQFAQFKREKGMIVVYCVFIVIIGIIAPLFIHKVESSLPMAALFTAMYLMPMLADSLAGEREHRTLETLLSSPLGGKSIIWGKFQFCLVFALCFFGLSSLCAAVTNWLASYELPLNAWQWSGMIVLAVFNFSTISIAGVYTSATSADLRTANSRISILAYPFSLLFIAYIPLLISLDFFPVLIISVILLLLYFCVIIIFVVKVNKMKQSKYFENIKIKKSRKEHENDTSYSAPKSQFGIVFGCELKYLMTLKTMLFNFVIMALGPALIVCSLCYYTLELDLNYAVLTTVLVIPRIPTNLIAASIGGEKAYKTGESLLSTPLQIRPMFLAKCMVPIVISVILLVLSSLLTIAGGNIVSWVQPGLGPIPRYTAGQLVLLFPVGILSSMLMMFISAVLSVVLKTPRHAYFVTSFVSFIFVVPVLAIVYLTANILLWSLVYAFVLLLCNVICVRSISDKISRPQIMSRL